MIDTEGTQQREVRTKTTTPLSKVNGEKVKGYEEDKGGSRGGGGMHLRQLERAVLRT